MKNIIVTISILALVLGAFAPLASAQVYTPECINESYLNHSTVFDLNGERQAIIQDPVFCPYGCDERAGVYGADCKVNTGTMTIEIYLVLFFLALGSMILGFVKKTMLPLILSVILFAVLAIQANSIVIISGGISTYIQQPVLILLNWLFLMIAFALTLVATVGIIKGKEKLGTE